MASRSVAEKEAVAVTQPAIKIAKIQLSHEVTPKPIVENSDPRVSAFAQMRFAEEIQKPAVVQEQSAKERIESDLQAVMHSEEVHTTRQLTEAVHMQTAPGSVQLPKITKEYELAPISWQGWDKEENIAQVTPETSLSRTSSGELVAEDGREEIVDAAEDSEFVSVDPEHIALEQLFLEDVSAEISDEPMDEPEVVTFITRGRDMLVESLGQALSSNEMYDETDISISEVIVTVLKEMAAEYETVEPITLGELLPKNDFELNETDTEEKPPVLIEAIAAYVEQSGDFEPEQQEAITLKIQEIAAISQKIIELQLSTEPVSPEYVALIEGRLETVCEGLLQALEIEYDEAMLKRFVQTVMKQELDSVIQILELRIAAEKDGTHEQKCFALSDVQVAAGLGLPFNVIGRYAMSAA